MIPTEGRNKTSEEMNDAHVGNCEYRIFDNRVIGGLGSIENIGRVTVVVKHGACVFTAG